MGLRGIHFSVSYSDNDQPPRCDVDDDRTNREARGIHSPVGRADRPGPVDAVHDDAGDGVEGDEAALVYTTDRCRCTLVYWMTHTGVDPLKVVAWRTVLSPFQSRSMMDRLRMTLALPTNCW